MQITTIIDEEQMVKDIFGNLQDGCGVGYYDLIAENPDEFEYTFRDPETKEEYEIDLEMAKEGFREFGAAVSRRELSDSLDFFTDDLTQVEFFDEMAIDYLIQFIINGEVTHQ